MACRHPIVIKNKAYTCGDDISTSNLALRPWDVARQHLIVPCGKCEDCLRRLRNDWFVRIERELAFSRHICSESCFVTISIAPKYYDHALLDPSWFIRKWFERVRYHTGSSVKHVLFQEFGTDPQNGNEPRLHFHGFLFHLDMDYNTLREAIGDLGFIWISKPTIGRARYAVKYVCKDILNKNKNDISDKFVTVAGLRRRLDSVLTDSRYCRKFVSAGVGAWLGCKPRPSARTSSWSYMDSRTGRVFNYAIPRYFDRFRTEEERIKLALVSADSYARHSSSTLVKHIVSECFKKWFPEGVASLAASRNTYTWYCRQAEKLSSVKTELHVDPPAQLMAHQTGPLLLDFWQQEYGICIT